MRVNKTRRVTHALASSRGLFLTAVIAGSLSGLAFLGIGEAEHVVTARFADADGLVAGNEVRIAGVSAGTVKQVQMAVDPSNGQQYAQVQMDIDQSHWPLHQGTKVAVKPKGVLSNVYVYLEPGPTANPLLGDKPFFELNQTQSPVNLDELSNIFDPSVRDSIRTQLQEGVLALGGTGAANLNQTLVYANPLTRDAGPVTGVLATRSPELDRLNTEFDTISGELAREDSNLRPLIVNLNTLLSALAASEADIQGTLDHAAGVFTELDQTFKSPQTQADLRSILTLGPNALSCANALATYFSPLINNVNPHIVSLDVLLGEFITATGYNNYSGAPGSSPIDTLRIDPTLPPNGFSGQESGGLASSHDVVPSGPATTFPNPLPVSGSGFSAGCAQPPGLVVP